MAQTPIGLGLSWPLTFIHLLGVEPSIFTTVYIYVLWFRLFYLIVYLYVCIYIYIVLVHMLTQSQH